MLAASDQWLVECRLRGIQEDVASDPWDTVHLSVGTSPDLVYRYWLNWVDYCVRVYIRTYVVT